MPWRLDDASAKIQFMTSAETPALIYEACVKLGIPSNTVYLQQVVCEALARDLDLDLDDLFSRLPSPQGRARVLFGGDRTAIRRVGPSGANEEVR